MATADQQAVAATKPVLPATFANSFWSTDYRTGLQSLFTALDAATVQSQELAAHVERRSRLERTLADGLVPPALRKDGFALDEGASLRIGFEALLTSSVSEARARERLAEDLERTILVPFSSWSASHAHRISTSRTTLFTALDSYESQHALVARLKLAYDSACRNADLAEDEYRFVAARDELGSAHVPPRPDDLPDHLPAQQPQPHHDDDDKPLGLDRRREDSARAAKSIDDDAEGEPDEGLIGRSGATGGATGGASSSGGVLSALGRALSVRRSGAGAGALRQGRKNLDDDEKEENDEVVTAAATEGGVGGGGTPREGNEGLHLPAGLHLPTIDANEVKARLDWSKTKFSSLLSNVVGPQTGLEKYEKAKKDAEIAEEKYKREVVILDRLRLSLEETISTHLPYLQRCESDRLRAATSVLRSFHAAIAALPKLIDASLERVGQALELCRPEKDLKAIIERRRTGPFQPSPATFQSHYSDEPLSTFGIDLRKYDETNRERETAPVPRVLVLLLEWVEKKGKDASDEERRKAWLYDVPFASQHSLRAMLNPPALLRAHDGAGPDLSSVDLPVLCATTKLWFLELEQPPFTWAAYDELRSGWSTRAGITEGGGETDDTKEKVTLLAKVVGKLPKIHFEVLRAVVVNLVEMIQTTKTEEPLDVYLHKLSLSLARPLLRPKQTTPLSLDDRFPAAVISFLLTHPDEVFDKAAEIAKKEREDRYRPRRQRTKPVDERVRRSNLPVVAGSPPPPVPPRTGQSLTVKTGDQEGRLSVPEKDVVLVSSPTEATREELSVPPAPAPDPDNQPRQTSADEPEEGDSTPTVHTRSRSDLPEPVPVVPSPSSLVAAPSEQPPSPVEARFVPPTSSSEAANPSLGGGGPSPEKYAEETENPLDQIFLPPDAVKARKPTSPDDPLRLMAAVQGEVSGWAPSSSSLKRSTGPAGSGGRGLRGARGPRPPSQVLARVQALEQETHGSETSSSSAARSSSEQKRETA